MRHVTKRNRQPLLWVLSLMIVASMVCSFVVALRPPDAGRQAPPTSGILPEVESRRATDTPPARPAATRTPSQTPRATATQPGSDGVTVVPPQPPSRPTGVAALGYTFSVCGDNRNGPDIYRKILEAARADGSSFLINTGDLVASGREGEFAEFAGLMQGFPLPFYPVPGNHDNADGLLTAYLKYSGATAANYSFDYGQAHFSMLDTSLGEFTPAGQTWLTRDLDATRQPLKIVVLHHPPFDPVGGDHIMNRGNQAFMDLMVQKGARLVFAGHIHTYDRAVRDGVEYIITGGAGAPLYPEPSRPAYYHYLRVSVRGDQYSIEVVRIAK